MESSENFVKELCEIFAEKGLFNREDIEALKRDFRQSSNNAFEDFLIVEGLIPKDDLLEVLSEYYSVPSIDIVGVFFDQHLVTMFPKGVMLRNTFIPYRRDGDILFFVTNNPRNVDLEAIIGEYVSYDVEYMVGLPRDIHDMVKDFYDDPITQAELDEELSIDEEAVENQGFTIEGIEIKQEPAQED